MSASSAATSTRSDTNTLSPVEALEGLIADLRALERYRFQRQYCTTDECHLRLLDKIADTENAVEWQRQIILDALTGGDE